MASTSHDNGGLRVTPHTLNRYVGRGAPIRTSVPGAKYTGGIKLPVFPKITLPVINVPFGSNYGRAGIQGALQTGNDPNNPLKRILRGR